MTLTAQISVYLLSTDFRLPPFTFFLPLLFFPFVPTFLSSLFRFCGSWVSFLALTQLVWDKKALLLLLLWDFQWHRLFSPSIPVYFLIKYSKGSILSINHDAFLADTYLKHLYRIMVFKLLIRVHILCKQTRPTASIMDLSDLMSHRFPMKN